MSSTAFILIVTADVAQGARLKELLRERHQHSCRVVDTLAAALDSIRARAPDVVVAGADVGGQAAAGPLAKALAEASQDATLIVVGEAADPPEAAAIHYQRVPAIESVDGLAVLVEPIAQAAGQAAARREDRLVSQSLAAQVVTDFEGLVGVSPAMRKIVERIKLVARNKLTVTILGETGTGKELIARAIHNQSNRAARPFRAINCAGISETLVESELFGHVKGAFTGATGDKPGLFAAADGGTVFLDEIGDMPLAMQAKLLRVLEQREITPVGSHEVRKVDVRVIAATNANLRERIEKREFRDDLYYRLNQYVIEAPPLRDRRQDIPILAMHILRQANRDHGLELEGFGKDALDALVRYPWPGNVRELTNVIHRAAVEAEGRRIEARSLPDEIAGSRELAPIGPELPILPLEQMERLLIERALLLHDGNREQAAKSLGIGTRTLYRKIKEYDLRE